MEWKCLSRYGNSCGARAEYAGEMVLKNARGWCTPQEITVGIEVIRVFIKISLSR